MGLIDALHFLVEEIRGEGPMKFAACCVLGLIASPVLGSVYTDPTGDIATGNPNLDLTSVTVWDNGSDLGFTITVDNLDADWGKYMLFIDYQDGGSGDNDNPWARNVSGLGGMDFFSGMWLDNGYNATAYSYSDGWYENYTTTIDVDWASNSITFSMMDVVTSWMDQGITGFDFEVGTTGGGAGDPAIDLIGAEGTQSGWGSGSTSTDLMHYDFSTVPAPGALALLGLAGLTSRRRRRH
jgi:MYXO-CTERM domain-containing protein